MRQSTPIRIQLDPAECGAACLGILLDWHGRYVPPAELRQQCDVSRAGSSAAAIIRAAAKYNLDGAGVRVEVDQLPSLQLPAIIHWRLSHFIVLESFDRSGLWVNDPAIGRRKISWQEFHDCFTGIALTFQKTSEFLTGGCKPTVVSGLWRRLRNFHGTIAMTLLATLITVVPTVFFAVGTRVFVDEAIVPGNGEIVRPLCWILVAAILVQAITHWGKANSLRWLRARLKWDLTYQFLIALFNKPLLFYLQRYPAELASRCRLNDRVAETISHGVLDACSGLLASLLLLGLMVALSPWLTLAIVATMSINLVVIGVLSRQRTELSQQIASSEGQLLGSSIEWLEAEESITTSGLQHVMFARWHNFWRQTAACRLRVEQTSGLILAFNSFTSLLAGTITIGLGGALVLYSQISLGSLIAFQILVPFFTAPLTAIANLGSQLQLLAADLARIEDVTETGSAVVPAHQQTLAENAREHALETGKPKPSATLPAASPLRVKDLQFGFNAGQSGLLHDLSFSVAPGQWLGITGPSGSGKSTLSRLLAGLYQPGNGTIQWDQRSLDSWSEAERSRVVGYVDQTSVLFPMSLRENLLFGAPPFEDRLLLDVCEELGLQSLTHGSTAGLGLQIREGGVNLSGGQRQRVDIARHLLHPPTALILDEATSGLDQTNEKRVLDALRRRPFTCILVSHRPKVLAQCDQILFLRDGQQIDFGSQEEVLARCREYRELVEEEQ